MLATRVPMRMIILAVSMLINALAVVSLGILEKPASLGFFQGAITLGGGLLICFAFSLKMQWHGIIGAGVLALLGFAKGLGNLTHLIPPNRPDAKSLMELVVTLASGSLLTIVARCLLKERRKRQVARLRSE